MVNRDIQPGKLAAEAIDILRRSADGRAAARVRTYFKPEESIFAYGVKTPRLRQSERELFQE